MASFLFAATLSAPVAADQVSDGLDQVRVKFRAGKTDEGLEILEKLREEHRGDPRIEYERFLVLEKLVRRNDAADALEEAVHVLAEYKKAGGKNSSILSLEKKISESAAVALLYRREVGSQTAAYREKGVALAKKLAGGESRGQLAHVLWALARAGEAEGPEEDPLLGEIAKEVGSEALAAHVESESARSEARPAPSKEEAGLLKQNLAAAQRALQAKQYEEARLSALAALEVSPSDLTALVILSEALLGLSRNPEAAEAALRAMEAPKAGTRNAVSLYRRAAAVAKKVAPDLAAFQTLREETVDEILKILRKAQQQKRTHDVEWITGLVRRVSAADPDVEALVLAASAPVKAKPAKEKPKRGPPGFLSLLDPSIEWIWREKGPGSGLVGKELVFTNNQSEFMCITTAPLVILARKFTLRFEFFYDIESDETDEPMFFMFDGDPAAKDEHRAILLIPEGRHHTGFARQPVGSTWKIGETQALPEGIPEKRKWESCEITWDDATKQLKFVIAGKVAFDYKLRPTDTLHGRLSLGIAQAKEMRLRELYLRNEP